MLLRFRVLALALLALVLVLGGSGAVAYWIGSGETPALRAGLDDAAPLAVSPPSDPLDAGPTAAPIPFETRGDLAGGPWTVTPNGCCIPADASVTLAGDVNGASNANTVNAISGSTPILITPSVLEWTSGTATPTLTQATPTSDVPTVPLLIQSQAPYAGAVTNKSPGSIVFDVPNPVGVGAPALFQFDVGGSYYSALGQYQNGTAFGSLWLGTGHAPSGLTNAALSSDDNTITILNANTSGALSFRVANTEYSGLTSSRASFGTPLGGESGTNAFAWAAGSVALTSGTGNVLSSSQYSQPHIKFTGTLTGSGTTVTFPATDGACWDLDFSAVSSIAFSISLIANGATWGTNVLNVGTEFPHVCYSSGVGRLVGTSLTE